MRVYLLTDFKGKVFEVFESKELANRYAKNRHFDREYLIEEKEVLEKAMYEVKCNVLVNAYSMNQVEAWAREVFGEGFERHVIIDKVIFEEDKEIDEDLI